MLGDALRRYAEHKGRGYPDWALRYLPIVDGLGDALHGDHRILEIGANANGLARFAQRRVIAVDRELEQLRECRANQDVLPVLADINALPFADHALRAVVCVDTFEHLPPGTRKRAGDEIARVLSEDGLGLVAFPSGEAAAEAECEIVDAYRRYTGGTIRWLEEHAEHGLPDADTVRQDLAASAPNHRITQEGNCNVGVWRWTWRILMCGWPGRGNALAQVVLLWLAPWLARRQTPPFYRAFLWIRPQ